MKTPCIQALWGTLLLVGLVACMPGLTLAQDGNEAGKFSADLRQAQELEKAGKLAEAVVIYERMVKAAPALVGADSTGFANLIFILAHHYAELGQYSKAEPLYLRSLEILEAKLGKDHPKVAASLITLARLYEGMVEYGKAEPLYQRSLEIREAKLGKDHPDVARTLGKLAELYRITGQYGEAEPLYQRSLEILETKLDKDHPDITASLNNLAMLYQAMGQYSKAEPLYQRSLEIKEAKLKDDPVVALSLNNLATLYQAMGQYSKAEPLYQRSLEIQEAKLGKDHPHVAASLDNLATLYRAMGQYGKAEPLFQRSLEIREAKLGKDHPDVARSLISLAALYGDMGQYGKAEPLFQRSLDIREARLGKDHPDVASSLINLAALYKDMGQYGKAEPLFQRSLDIREAKLGKDHPDVASSLNNLAGLYDNMGQYGKAEPLYQRSLEIREAKLGKDHPDVATCLNNLAELYRVLGQYGKAEPLYQRSLDILEAKLGKDHPDVARSLNNLALLYDNMGRYGRAEPLYQRSLDILEAKLGKDHPDVALSLNNLAELYRVMGQYGKAEPLYQRSLGIWETRLGKDHPDVALSLNNLAGLYYAQGQYGKAEPLFQRSLDIREAKLGKDHPDIATSLNNLAGLYDAQGQYGKAEPLYQRSLDIREAKLGKDHPHVATSLNNLALLSEATNRTARATDLFHRARQAARRHIAHVLPALTEPDQATFLRHADEAHFHCALSLGLHHADDRNLGSRSAAWLLNGKAVAQQALAEVTLLLRDSQDPQHADLARQLADTRHRLAQLTLAVPKPGQEDQTRRQREQLADQEQLFAKQLRHAGGHAARDVDWVELDDLRRRLPADAVFIDLVRFNVFDFKATGKQKQWQPARYAAWITPAQGQIQVIDLGPAEAIDQAVKETRQGLANANKTIPLKGELDAETALRQHLDKLATLVLKPLLPHIGKSQRWLISPDSNLWLVPWAALPLPDGKYAVEAHVISYLVSGRDLVREPIRAAIKPTAPLVLADPDFDLGLDEAAALSLSLLREQGADTGVALAGRQASGLLGEFRIHMEFLGDGSFVMREGHAKGEVFGKGRWTLLGDTLRAETEKSLYRGQLNGQKVTGQRQFKDNSQPAEVWSLTLDRTPEPLLARLDVRSSSQRLGSVPRLPFTATEAEQITPTLRKYAGKQPRTYLDKQALAALVQSARNPRVLVLSTHGFFLPDQEEDPNLERGRATGDGQRRVKNWENPLLRSGLLLAGCNNASKTREGADNGVLTGLQIVSTDLRGCELVVLSACETGLGEVRNGEGVAGLRQAFQLAGAESVVATLWQIPDQQTTQLMIRFFDNLAERQSKAEALRNAQLTLIKARRARSNAAHPFFWAAFTLTGS